MACSQQLFSALHDSVDGLQIEPGSRHERPLSQRPNSWVGELFAQVTGPTSGGGAPDHPGWYKNLVAHPDVKIQVRDKVIPVTARAATAPEKKRLWSIMTKEWPQYDEYQAGTKRDIPLVVLTPR